MQKEHLGGIRDVETCAGVTEYCLRSDFRDQIEFIRVLFHEYCFTSCHPADCLD